MSCDTNKISILNEPYHEKTYFSGVRIIEMLIRLNWHTCWSAALLFKDDINRFCHDEVQIDFKVFEPTHEKTELSDVQFEILQMRMHSLWKGSDVRLFAWSFLHIPMLYEWTAKALARLRKCAGSPEPSLVTYVISTFFIWAGSFIHLLVCEFHGNVKGDQKLFANCGL